MKDATTKGDGMSGSKFAIGERVGTPMGEGRTVLVEDFRDEGDDFMWNVMLDRPDAPEQYEEMFWERNLTKVTA